MSKRIEGEVAWNVSIPEEMAEAMKSLAAGNRRSVREETMAAMRRHLAAPPIVRIIETEPPLEGEVIEQEPPPAPKEAKKKQQKKS